MASQRRRIMLRPQLDLILDVIVDGEHGLPPIVLLPSSKRDSEDFDNVAERIAKAGYLVLRPQPRGMGASIGPLDKLTLHVLAGDVATTIRELASGHRAVIVGHAYGHYVARVTDLDYPELVRGVVLAACSQREKVDPSLIISLDRAADDSLSLEQRLAHLYHGFFTTHSDASVWLTGWYPRLGTIYRDASNDPPKTEWWPVSNAPILDLQAAEDPWRPHHTRYELQDALGNLVTVCVIEQASHALFLEQPVKVANAIIDWVDSIPM